MQVFKLKFVFGQNFILNKFFCFYSYVYMCMNIMQIITNSSFNDSQAFFILARVEFVKKFQVI